MQCQLGVLAIYFKPNCYFYDISSYELGIDLNIDLEPGMTGDFQLVKKRSGNKWSSIFDTIYLNDDESKLLVSGNAIESDYLAAFYSDGDYNFSLKEKGNVLILSVTIAD